jgi:hypothetical protein
MKIELTNLFVTQNNIRSVAAIPEMIEYVKSGGLWDRDFLKKFADDKSLKVSPLVQISQFPDGSQYVHDGHHRTTSTYLAGRFYLEPSEYVISMWDYDKYLEISHANGWYTPFDPRTHLRLSDFGQFKKEARRRFGSGEDPENWIRENAPMFCVLRDINYVPELAMIVEKTLRKAA